MRFRSPAGVSSDPATTSTKYRQQITNKFTVVVCVSLTQDDVLGKTGHDYIEELKEQVFHAILGLPLGYGIHGEDCLFRFSDSEQQRLQRRSAR